MEQFDLIIIGGGPGGYVAAIRAGQLGLKVALVERRNLGGQCLNWGCIPSKCMTESARTYQRVLEAGTFGVDGIDKSALSFNWGKAVARKDRIVRKLVGGVGFLMKKNKVTVIQGEAAVLGPTRVRVTGEKTDEFGCRHLLVATGAIPDPAQTAKLERDQWWTLPEFYSRKELPQKMIVLGGGGPACETASMLTLAGYDVEMVTPQAELLSFLDASLKEFVSQRMKKLRVHVIHSMESLRREGEQYFVGSEALAGTAVVNCADRIPTLPAWEGRGLQLDTRGFLKVDGFGRTSLAGVYAVGDVTGTLWAQSAAAQGTAAVNHMAGIEAPLVHDHVPLNIYLVPEVAAVGLTEEEAVTQGHDVRVGEFPLTANGKALSEGNSDGFVKVVAERRYGEVLGVHIVAENATDLIAEAAAYLKLEATLEEMAQIVHAHPTLSEAFWEAGMDALETPIHK